MIEVYSGTPGSGKSAHVMKVISDYAWTGSEVVTNIALCRRPLGAKRGWQPTIIDTLELDPSALLADRGRHREDSRLLVIDEAQLLFNTRNWNDNQRSVWIKFFTQHRKLGWRVVLVTQDINMLDKQMRSLVEQNIVHRRMDALGITGKLFSLLTFKHVFGWVKIWPYGRQIVGKGVFILWPWLSRMYQTNDLLER